MAVFGVIANYCGVRRHCLICSEKSQASLLCVTDTCTSCMNERESEVEKNTKPGGQARVNEERKRRGFLFLVVWLCFFSSSWSKGKKKKKEKEKTLNPELSFPVLHRKRMG